MYMCMCVSGFVLWRGWLPEVVAPGSSHAAWRMSRWRRAPAVTVHHTQRDAGRESHYERRSEEVHDDSDLCLAIIVRQHYATIHPAIMAGKLRALVTQLAGEVLAIDCRRISAALDVDQQHRLDVPRRGHCSTKRRFTAEINIRQIWIFKLAEHACIVDLSNWNVFQFLFDFPGDTFYFIVK